MLKAWICILLIGAAAMALPAVSSAQSAGDDQYQDPLSGGGGGSGASGSGNSGGGGGGSTSPGSSGSAGESAQSAQSGQAAQSAQSGQLPRTGLPAGVLALSGGALLGAGVALRRRVSPRPEQ